MASSAFVRSLIKRFCAMFLALAGVSLHAAPGFTQIHRPSIRAKRASVRSLASQALVLSFAPAVAYGSNGDGAVSVAVADVNGDGKPDLVVVNECSNSACTTGTVGVMLGNGDGTFQAAVTYGSGGNTPTSVAAADVNGDGKLDLIVANGCASNTASCNNGTVGVLLGNGDGTFQAAVTYSTGGIYANAVAVADVNGDGKPDLLVANGCAGMFGGCTGSTGVLLNKGDGTFQPVVQYLGGGVSVTVADLNGDGKPDLVAANTPVSDPGNVSVFLGNGDGTFQAAVPYLAGYGPRSAAVADLNGDGKLDIVVSITSVTNPGEGGISVLLGNGDGTFQSAVPFVLGGGFEASSVAIADVNEDGKPDLVVAQCANCQADGSAGVLLGNGDGSFQAEVVYGSGGIAAKSVAIADVNGDGKPDVLVANECVSGGTCPGNGTVAGSVGVLINTSGMKAVVALSPTSLNFGPQPVGVTTAPQSVTLTNTGDIALAITSIAITGNNSTDFAQTNNCPSSLPANGSCNIKATFTPTAAGSRSAAVSVTDNAAGSPQSVALQGTVEDFGLAASPPTETITPGQAGNYTLTVAPINGFNQSVSLTCSAVAPGSSCTVTPSKVTLTTSSATANIAVVTTAAAMSVIEPQTGPPRGNMVALWLTLSGTLGLVWLGSFGRSHRPRRLRGLAFLCLLYVGIIWSACGGGGSMGSGGGGTTAGTYNPTVTGTFTSGPTKLTHTIKLTLVVQ